MINISIIGLGQFGYALLKYLERQGRKDISILAYDRNHEVISSLSSFGRHPFIFSEEVISNVSFTDKLYDLSNSDIVIFSINSTALPEVFKNLRGVLRDDFLLINTSKALAAVSGQRLSEMAFETLGVDSSRYTAFSGGTIASDLFLGHPVGATLACPDQNNRKKLANLFNGGALIIEESGDLAGVECAGALKNVVSIICGLVEGSGASCSSKSLVFSQAAKEAAELAIDRFGSNPATFSFSSQCWGNDLFLACSDHTRNISFGRLLGEGKNKEEALTALNLKPEQIEGLNTLAGLEQMDYIANYPYIYQTIRLVSGRESLANFLERIFS